MIVLATTSSFKNEQFKELKLDFITKDPQVDETEIQEEPTFTPKEKAEKLALLKAKAVAELYPDATVVAGDQIASFEGKVLTKPGSKEKNIDQLLKMSGKEHELITANVIIEANGDIFRHCEIAGLHMKNMGLREIKEYVEKDEPWDCAGGYKFEKNGHRLFDNVECEDKEAIQGMCMAFLRTYFFS